MVAGADFGIEGGDVIRDEFGVLDAAPESFGDVKGILRTGIVEQQGEFFAADSGSDVGASNGVIDDGTQTFEDPVADGVAEGVVDVGEVIEVDQNDGHRFVGTAGVVDGVSCAFPEISRVSEAGQFVGDGALFEFVVESLQALFAASECPTESGEGQERTDGQIQVERPLGGNVPGVSAGDELAEVPAERGTEAEECALDAAADGRIDMAEPRGHRAV